MRWLTLGLHTHSVGDAFLSQLGRFPHNLKPHTSSPCHSIYKQEGLCIFFLCKFLMNLMDHLIVVLFLFWNLNFWSILHLHIRRNSQDGVFDPQDRSLSIVLIQRTSKFLGPSYFGSHTAALPQSIPLRQGLSIYNWKRPRWSHPHNYPCISKCSRILNCSKLGLMDKFCRGYTRTYLRRSW